MAEVLLIAGWRRTYV